MKSARRGCLKSQVALSAVVILLTLVGCAGHKPLYSHNPKVVEAANLTQQGNFDAALAALNQAIRENAQDSVAWNNRGFIFYKKGQYDKAIKDYSQAISIKGEGVRYDNRGDAYLALGRYDLAVADYKKATELGHAALWMSYAVGRAHYDKGRFSEAVVAFNAAIEKNRDHTNTYGYRGISLAYLKRYKEALADFDRYGPEDTFAMRLQGEAFMRTGQTDRAREVVRKLVLLEPRLAVNFGGDQALDVYDLEKRRAQTKQGLAAAQTAATAGKWPEAFAEYERARTWMNGDTGIDQADVAAIMEGQRRAYAHLKVKPGLPEAARKFQVQAVGALRDKQFTAAANYYAKAIQIAPWWPDGHFNRAMILGEAGDYENARHAMSYYLQLAPEAANARAAQDKIYDWERLGSR